MRTQTEQSPGCSTLARQHPSFQIVPNTVRPRSNLAVKESNLVKAPVTPFFRMVERLPNISWFPLNSFDIQLAGPQVKKSIPALASGGNALSGGRPKVLLRAFMESLVFSHPVTRPVSIENSTMPLEKFQVSLTLASRPTKSFSFLNLVPHSVSIQDGVPCNLATSSLWESIEKKSAVVTLGPGTSFIFNPPPKLLHPVVLPALSKKTTPTLL